MLGAALSACAHGPAQPQKLALDPVVITAGAHSAELDAKTEQQLFDDGSVYFRAGKLQEAADHFDALFSRFPNSPQAVASLYDAGLAHERLGHFAESLDRFTAFLAHEPKREQQIEGLFHAALAEYKLGRREAAAARLHPLASELDVPPARRGDAAMQEAVCRFELGAPADAEKLLRQALQIFDHEMNGEVLDAGLPAQAEFWLGEIYRSHFLAAPLDPSAMDGDALGKAMEAKAELLLSAQGHYLRAIERGQGEWATAAGFRVGELFESFHGALTKAPVPKELDEGQAQMYRQELREKLRTLMSKAIQIYEQTLATAQRVGARNDYVEKTRQALERVRKLLLEDQSSL